MPETTTTQVTYVGPARGASLFAHELQEQGLQARYAPPRETKSLALAAEVAQVVFTVLGPLPALLIAAGRLSKRVPTARVEGLPEAEARPVQERLAEVEQLHRDGIINDQERTETRARILGEL